MVACEHWYSRYYDDVIQLKCKDECWIGIGEGFEFQRQTKTEAILLLLSWGYQKVAN